MHAKTIGERIRVGPNAQVIWKSPDLNTKDLDYACAERSEWTRESGAPVPKGYVITLNDTIEMDTVATWGDTILKVKAGATMVMDAAYQRVLSKRLQDWLVQNGITLDPMVWPLCSKQPKERGVYWYKTELERIDCDPDLMRGWDDAIYKTIRITDVLICSIPIKW